MNIYNRFKKQLKEDWYIQGFNSVPLFLNSCARSGFPMKKKLGYGYTKFLFNYKKGYGEMGYLNRDFKRIWSIIKGKLKTNPRYLKQLRKRYQKEINQYDNFFKKTDRTNLKKVGDSELLEMLKKCVDALTDSVGIAHVLDSIGIEIEKEFKKELSKIIPKTKEFNKCYAVLIVPSKLSFVAREEKELAKLGKLPEPTHSEKIKEHFRKYSWLQNSYAGPKKLSIGFFEKRLKSLKEKKDEQFQNIQLKRNLIRQYKLKKEIIEMLEIIDFSTIWQDERKADILKNIGHLGKVIEEVARRLKINKEKLYYLGVTDVFGIRTLNDIRALGKELTLRAEGVFFLMERGREKRIIGKKYNDLIKFRERLTQTSKKEEKEIHGSIANVGTAMGRVVICRGLSSMKKVKKGDILVTSMTRPEFMPALKKAAAIVTDEGGVTCHAAIVSRELGIPAVIGTKVATKILKDGMMVEVRANHGVVKIIE